MAENKSDIKYVDLNGNVCCIVKVDGNPVLYNQYIVSVEARSGLNTISNLKIVLDNIIDEEKELYISDTDIYKLGSEIEVLVGYNEAKESVFKGSIIKKSVSSYCSLLTIEAKHAADKMTVENKCRSFEDKTIQDTIEEVCGDYGIDVKVEKPGNKSEKRLQSNYTDWDFINLIAESEGMVVYTTSEGIVVKSIIEDLTKQEHVLDVVRGYNINTVELEIDSRCSHKEYKGKAFDSSKQEALESSSSVSNQSQSEENKEGESVTVASTGSAESEQEMDAKQNTMSARNDLAFLVGKLGLLGYAPLFPGDMVRLHKVGKGFNGKVLVSSVLQTIGPGRWETHLEVGYDNTPYVNRYNDIAPKPAMGMLPSVNGLQLAKVEALAGDPKGEDRIYVRLLNSNDMKLWCRVATLDAGNKRGSFFMPEKDDEVIVGFVDGNPNSAVILGMLHSSKAPVPLEITDDNHVKGFFSRENIQLLFDDEKKALSVETPGGNKLLISDDEKGISLEDQNGNTIVMNDQGITVESKKALTLKAAQDVSIEGNNVNIKANAQMVAKGSASAEVSSGGNTVIKGGLVQIN
ncbi:MAG: type VI secretion system tip protein VgrG [Paludibacteraceae bacterium]|nr:type VI secretion system tip protein VgrG [Paludibacteraceae bacterium]